MNPFFLPLSIMLAFGQAAQQMLRCPVGKGNEGNKPVNHTLLMTFGFACRVHKVSGILIVDGELVLVKRAATDPDGAKREWYEPFGGKPDYNYENPYALLAREGVEELGGRVVVGDCLGVGQHPKYRGRTVAYFKCGWMSSEKPRNEARGEHLDVVMCSPQRLRELVDSGADVQLPHSMVEKFIQTGDVISFNQVVFGPFARGVPESVPYVS